MKVSIKAISRRVAAFFTVYINAIAQGAMAVFGLVILGLGLESLANAQILIGPVGPASLAPPGIGVAAGDARLEVAGGRLFELLEGNFGSLVMITAGLAAIVSSAMGAYRAAVGLLIVAIGAFILKSLVVIFFDYTGA